MSDLEKVRFMELVLDSYNDCVQTNGKRTSKLHVNTKYVMANDELGKKLVFVHFPSDSFPSWKSCYINGSWRYGYELNPRYYEKVNAIVNQHRDTIMQHGYYVLKDMRDD